MANVCCNYIEVTGDATQLKSLRDKIINQDAELIQVLTWFETGCHYGLVQSLEEIEVNGDRLCVNVTTKWAPPEAELENLSEMFPLLDFKMCYEEPGMQVYGVVYAHDGVSSVEDLDEEAYCLEYGDLDEYKKEIEELPYKDFRETYLDAIDDLEDDYNLTHVPYVEKYIVQRANAEDLPLLIGHSWQSKYARELFESRLKEGSLPQTKEVAK